MAEQERKIMLNFVDEEMGRGISFEVSENLRIDDLWDELLKRGFYSERPHDRAIIELDGCVSSIKVKDVPLKNGDTLHIEIDETTELIRKLEEALQNSDDLEYYVDRDGRIQLEGGYTDVHMTKVEPQIFYGCPRAAEVPGIDAEVGCSVEIVAYE